MSTTRYQSITEALTQIKANQLNEDGHTDVPSSIRMCKTIMEDAYDILCALCNTDMDEEIDTWWTNKLAVSASTLNKLRDYYVHEVDDQEEDLDENIDMEAITSQYGKYAIPAGAAALGFTLAGEKSKRPTFKGFLKNALVAGAAGIGAEALKRQYTARNPLAPNASSPFFQKATNPFRKV